MKIKAFGEKLYGRFEEFKRKNTPSDYEKLQAELLAVKRNLDQAYQNFSLVSATDNIDYYIYSIKSYETQYHLLLKEIRNLDANKASNHHLMVEGTRMAQ